jgi:hypothetical protein
VSLNGSSSSDADHDPLTFSWSLLSRPVSSNAAIVGATTALPTFFADVAGAYVAQLIVNDGFTSSLPVTATITAGASGVTLSPNPLTMAGPSATLTVTLSSPAPAGGISFTVSSSNTAVATVPSGVFMQENSTTVGLRVNNMGVGSAVVRLMAAGFPDATATIIVPAPPPITLTGPATMPLNQVGTVNVSLSAPAPQPGVTVQLNSSDPHKVAFPVASVFIAAGRLTPDVQPQVTAVNVGSANITASAPGYTTSAGATINVTATVVWITQNATITGAGNQTSLTLQLTTHAPLDPSSDNPWSTGVMVNLTSSNPGVVTIQPTGIFIWDGSSAPGIVIPVTAIGPGTAVIHASGINIPDVTTTVTVVGH